MSRSEQHLSPQSGTGASHSGPAAREAVADTSLETRRPGPQAGSPRQQQQDRQIAQLRGTALARPAVPGAAPIQCFLGPHEPQTRSALSVAHGTADAGTLKGHADTLRNEIPAAVKGALTPMANSMTPKASDSQGASSAKSGAKAKAKQQPQAKGDGVKLLEQICNDLRLSRNGWADIQGYTRELSLGALYAGQDRLRQTKDSGDPRAKADAFWINSGGPAAAQMKTILDASKISAKENLPKAIRQVNGLHGETPPPEAARVADIGVTEAVDANALADIDHQVLAVVQEEKTAQADAIRIWLTVRKDKGAGRVGMLRQYDGAGRLTHAPEYPLPDFDVSGQSGVADFVQRGAPHELPIPYPASYPAGKRAGAVSPLKDLADDAKLLFGLSESLEKEVRVASSSTGGKASKAVEPSDEGSDTEGNLDSLF